MKSIQTKILTIIISAMLLLTTVISVISLIYMGKMLDEDSDIITESVTNTETLRINNVLREVEYVTQTMSNYVYSSINDGVQKLYDDAYRLQYLEAARETFSAVVGNLPEVASYHLRFNPQIGGPKSGFFISKVLGDSKFYELDPTDISNIESLTYEQICWYTEPQNKKGAVWINPYVKPNSNIKIISYAIPIYNNNTFIGVIGVDVEFSKITDMVSDISVYDNGFAYLAGNGENEIFFSPVSEHKLEQAHTDHGFAEDSNTLRNGMRLVIHADYSDIQKDSYRMIIIIIAIAFFLLAAFILITYFLTKAIVKPLKQLTGAAEMLADGKTELDLAECKTNDEIGILADVFEKTAEKLHSYMGYINALAYKDSLTSVKNRTAYNEMATENDVNIKMGNIESFGVFVADINNLKITNDKYGHEIGNKLIIKVARVICDVFKRSPVYRIGGDEFAVLLRGADLENCEQLINEMDLKISDSTIEIGDDIIDVSVARGVAIYDPEHDVCFEDIFERADKKMYEHKRKKQSGGK